MKKTYSGQAIPFVMVLLLVIAAALLLLTLAARSGSGIMGKAANDIMTGSWDLPLSSHAQTSHAQEKWNASSIQNFFRDRGCKPFNYDCDDGDRSISWCSVPGKAGKAIGLIIYRATQKIATGFQSDLDYWRFNACR